jgi:hypothetical protein
MHPAHRYMLFLKEAYSTFILFFERVANIQKVSADNISLHEITKSICTISRIFSYARIYTIQCPVLSMQAL